jgi:RsiW-degrading membrane proteinase PrsW (M82 family)
VGVTFLLGGVLGLTIAAVLEPVLLPPLASTGSITLGVAVLIGLVEETAKIVCVLWFLRDKRLRSELDGLILGAAAGMGFAALETAGYGFVAFLQGFVAQLGASQSQSLSSAQATVLAIEVGAQQMNYQLVIRMALAIFGHGVWTGIVAAAIWRERGQATFRLTWGVVVAFAIAVGLHALWDWSPLANMLPTTTDPLVALVVIFGWFLFVGLLGLFILRFFLRESIQRAKLGPYAPPAPPLVRALLDYTVHPFRSPRLQPAYPAYPYAPYPYAAQQVQQMPPQGPSAPR